jgi:hypothetical protein
MRVILPRSALLALVLSGCTITGLRMADIKPIDQRSFEGPAQAPGAAGVARARLPRQPLAVIRFDQQDADFRPALAAAVNAALARKPDPSFDVLTPMPSSAAPDIQDRFARQGAIDAQEVANALAADGIPPDQVHIGLRGDPGAPPREVLVYVR